MDLKPTSHVAFVFENNIGLLEPFHLAHLHYWQNPHIVLTPMIITMLQKKPLFLFHIDIMFEKLFCWGRPLSNGSVFMGYVVVAIGEGNMVLNMQYFQLYMFWAIIISVALRNMFIILKEFMLHINQRKKHDILYFLRQHQYRMLYR